MEEKDIEKSLKSQLNNLGCIVAVVFILCFALIIGFPIMWLWNWLMPDIFNLPTIGFWQAVGLSVLSGFLIKPINTK